ncbi:MAG: ABC transporter permease subunit [Chloroflexota bacterium]
MFDQNQDGEGSFLRRSIITILIGLFVLVLYAYGTDVTQVNLEEPQDPNRQEVAVRVIRALARPDFLDYREETRSMDITIRMPCPEDVKGSQTSLEDRQTVLIPNCVNTTQDSVVLQGSGFRPRTDGIIRWYPPGDVETTRALSTFRTDANGNFEADFTMPDIRPTDEPQRIEVEEKWRVGIAGLSESSILTIEKIIETIFMALMATTVGTLIAIPVSFIASRNLMIQVGSPLAAIMGGIIALPIGYLVGVQLTRTLLNITAVSQTNVPINIVGLIVGTALLVVAVRYAGAMLSNDLSGGRQILVNSLILLALIGLFFPTIGYLSNLGILIGEAIEPILGPFDFLGRFFGLLFEAVLVLSPGIMGLLLAFFGMSFGSFVGQEAVLGLDERLARGLTAVLCAIGAFVFVFGIGSALNWLYQYDEPQFWTTIPGAVAAVLGLIGGVLTHPKRQYPIGSIIYSTTRSLLNIIRSIEPLIYVIVFAVWVGIGPFAGILALTIHTIAALGKLYSEQVENISEGPLEAITATGANRLQTIVFGVIPQIVPPYIAFTLYRWDINVRFSTIIGFAGGGGIGFVLVQNINLLQYRQASVMMIAIALVVMTLDYVSSRIRARII